MYSIRRRLRVVLSLLIVLRVSFGTPFFSYEVPRLRSGCARRDNKIQKKLKRKKHQHTKRRATRRAWCGLVLGSRSIVQFFGSAGLNIQRKPFKNLDDSGAAGIFLGKSHRYFSIDIFLSKGVAGVTLQKFITLSPSDFFTKTTGHR